MKVKNVIFCNKSGAMTREMVETMNEKSMILAMANPTPEIMLDKAKAGGALVLGTGRSDFPNQVNNVLAFPGVFDENVADNVVKSAMNAVIKTKMNRI